MIFRRHPAATVRAVPIGRRIVVAPLALVAFLTVMAWQQPVRAEMPQATIDDAAHFITGLAQRAIEVLQRTNDSLEQREKEFRAILAEDFDLEFIGRFVLGRHWRKATPEQQADYQALFAEWLLKTYSRRLGGYAGETFETIDARAVGDEDVLVRTRINRPSGPPILADWRVRKQDDHFRIIDIMVEGISMAVTQRSEFNAVVSKDGIDGLLGILRARTQKLEMTS